MFTVTHDSRTHSYQCSCPQLQCVGATDASRLAHQVTNSSAHSFYAAGRSRQIQFRIFSIGSEMVDPPEKLPNDHADDAQSCCLANQMPQLFENAFQMGTVGEIEGLAGQLVERFAQGPASQPVVSSASAGLQSADEMEMAELNDPALAAAQPDYARNLVGNRRPDASVYISGDRRDCLRPTPQVLPACQEQRIEEDGSIVVARLDRHQVQHPVFSLKPEVESVQQQNQRPCRQAQAARSGHKLVQSPTESVAHCLTGEATARCETFQSSSLHQDRLQKLGRTSPMLGTPAFLADPPCSLALHALATSQSKTINFCSATGRFRVRGMHARELATDSYLKYAESQTNYA